MSDTSSKKETTIKDVVKNNIQYLDKKIAFKFIGGASLTDIDKIKGLSLLFTLCGANIIDISPYESTIKASLEGIQQAKTLFEQHPDLYPYYNEPVLMISLNVSDDPHFRKARVNPDICIACGLCIDSCHFNALSLNPAQSSLCIDSNTCYGCGQCLPKCDNNALYLEFNEIDFKEILTKLIEHQIRGIEIHTGSSNFKELSNFWVDLENNLGKDFMKNLLISFSVESSLFSSKEFVNYVNSIITLTDQKLIIQVDGRPMSGSSDAGSTLQALSAGQNLTSNNVNAYVILAGGINHLTYKYSKAFDIHCSGIAMGTFARKLLWPYLDRLDEEVIFNKAIQITTNLVKTLEF